MHIARFVQVISVLGFQSMSSMEQDGLPGSTQSGAGQRQLDPQEEAKAASRDALEAQQGAQEAIKRAYMKQMTAQEKAVQASQQVAAQQESCKMAATLAAREAAEKAANEQKKKSEKEMHETSIAQEAAHNALAFYAGNQVSNHLGPSTFTYQPTQPTGFNANTGAISDSPVQAQMYQGYPVSGGVQQNQAQPMVDDSSDFQSAKLCQQMLMQAANQMGVNAASQMAAAQSLVTSATDPHSQQVAREQGEVAQQQMTLASQLAAAAQAPESAVQAAANLPGLLNKA